MDKQQRYDELYLDIAKRIGEMSHDTEHKVGAVMLKIIIYSHSDLMVCLRVWIMNVKILMVLQEKKLYMQKLMHYVS